MPLESLRPDARPKIQKLSTETPESRSPEFNLQEKLKELRKTDFFDKNGFWKRNISGNLDTTPNILSDYLSSTFDPNIINFELK